MEIKKGTTPTLAITIKNAEDAEKIIFTVKKGEVIIQKEYPGDVRLKDGKYYVGLSQNETESLGEGIAALEAQINLPRGQVAKSRQLIFCIDDSISTTAAEDESTAGDSGAQVDMSIEEVFVGADGATFIPIVTTPEDGKLRIEWKNTAGLPNPEVAELIAPKGEKGDKGATGAQGYTPIRGTDYWTDGDKQEIVSNTKESIKPDISAALTQAKTYTDASSALSIKSVSYNADTAVFTFTRGDGTDIVIDLPIEATVKNGYYDPTEKELSLVLVNNQEIRIPASGLIADYDGSTTGTIQCSVSADNIISCKIVSGSVSKTLLTEALQTEIDQKADRAQTLSGYGITDAYTKAEVDAKTAPASQSHYGTSKMWVSYDGDEAVLNILTEDSEDEA